MYKCRVCKKQLDDSEAYEYRGVYSCEEHFDEVCELREFERQEIIKEEKLKTDKFKGLDLSNSQIGKANKELLKRDLEIAKKESNRLKRYERGDERKAGYNLKKDS